MRWLRAWRHRRARRGYRVGGIVPKSKLVQIHTDYVVYAVPVIGWTTTDDGDW